jgi:ABC-2 type transport system ATP-binding protein
MEAALRVEGVCKRFPGFALTDVSFELPRGYVMGFVGRNGSGKTTVIRIIMALMRRDAGSVQIFGREQGTDAIELRERIGFVYDEQGFHGGMTVAATGRMIAPFYSTWNGREFARRLEHFDLDPTQKTADLSRGQRMRLALAIALAHDAELLVMDEPTSGLDPVFRSELIDILHGILQDGRKAIFFSTHLTTDLEKIADFVTFIDEGRIVLSESKEALQERFRIVKGPPEALTDRARTMCVGTRETHTGFEALSARADDLAELVGSRAVVELATLEDIMVYMTRGKGNE